MAQTTEKTKARFPETATSDRKEIARAESNAYRKTVPEIVAELQTSVERGLTASDVTERLSRYGKNELQTEPPIPAWRRFLMQFQGPLTLLLLVATIVSFVAHVLEGEGGVPYESLTILAVVVVNAILGYWQEAQAEEAVASLQKMSSAQAVVVRDGKRQTLPTENLVPGDVLLLEEGATIPADGRLVESAGLQSAEAALTGESSPVVKTIDPIDEEAGVGDRVNMVFRGASVTFGHGKAIVTATGMQTELGKVAGLLHETGSEETPLQKQLDTVGKMLGIAVLVIAVVVAVTIIGVQRVSSTTALLTVLLYAVSLAVSAVPEGLTVVTTVVLSLGVQRMAKRNVIVRKLAAVETLGSATVICTDKTGTLTRNEMTVRALVTASGRTDVTGTGYTTEGELSEVSDTAKHEVATALRAAVFANNAELTEKDGQPTVQGDPTEGALLVVARKGNIETDWLREESPRQGEVPFSSERKRMSVVVEADGSSPVLFSKGAPDVLLALCTSEQVGNETRPLTDERRTEIQDAVNGLAKEALRTIGVACKTMTDTAVTEADEQELTWLGVFGMIDPPRSEAAEAVKEAHKAGIRILMITGDHPVSAAKIAQELGIAKGEKAISGAELQKMDEAALKSAVRETNVYARVSPEHKLRIVRALKANGEIVAMTGDGANDAPALKAADIGVAMGITGTDVSKEAADMVLTDDNFASIVAAVEEGRSIYADIQKFLTYLLASNLGEVIVFFLGAVLAGVLGLAAGRGEAVALPLLATMILWINLLTDSGPALALGMEPVDPDVMEHPPRDPRQPVITRPMWASIAGAGAVMALGTLSVLDGYLPGGLIPGDHSLDYARTMAFTTLVLYQLFNVFCIRSEERSAFYRPFSNPYLWAAVGLAAALQVIVVYFPPLQKAFGTVALNPIDWFVAFAVASTILWFLEAVKLVNRWRNPTGNSPGQNRT